MNTPERTVIDVPGLGRLIIHPSGDAYVVRKSGHRKVRDPVLLQQIHELVESEKTRLATKQESEDATA